MKIANRLWLILGASMAGILIAIALGLYGLKGQMLEDREIKTRHIVEIGQGIISHFANEATEGRMSVPDAQQGAMAALRKIRYEGVEYLWIHDRSAPFPKMLMHPTVPALEGKSLDSPNFNRAFSSRAANETKTTTLDNKNLFVTFNEVVARGGEGTVSYAWPKPKQGGGTTEELYPKMSYVKAAPWGWVVGSGIYIDDVNATFWKSAGMQAVPAVLLGALVAAIALLMAIAILKPLRLLSKTLSDIEQTGDLSLRVPFRSRDEVGQAAAALNGFLGHLEPVLEDVKKVMTGVANNDLSKRVKAEAHSKLVADIKTSVNASLDSLSAVLRTIMQEIRQVAVATSQTSLAVSQISQGAQGQMNAINQIMVGISQTAQAVEDVSSNTKVSSENARQAAIEVRDGRERIADMSNSVASIAANSEEIGKITEVIRQIARRTDMLSLNAAIEATQAGTAGSGFGVVAKEVGKLAELSGRSVGQIDALIAKATQETARGVNLARIVGDSIETIAAGVGQNERMADAIAGAIQQQSSAVEQIHASVEELSRIGQTNASASEEVSATVIELSRLADRTRLEIERFTL